MKNLLIASALAVSLGACATMDKPEPMIVSADCPAKSMAVFFDTGSSSLDSAARNEIANIAAEYNRCDLYRIDVVGYADSVGNSQLNLNLSDARADSVLAALNAMGVSADRSRIVPMGERTAIDTNMPDQWERRAVVTLIP